MAEEKKKPGRPSFEKVFREALERIHNMGGQQGAIAREALIKANKKP